MGNGFDLHYGIPCSYQDYRQWLENKYSNVHCMINEYQEYPSSDWWCNFEVSLGTKDIIECALNEFSGFFQ